MPRCGQISRRANTDPSAARPSSIGSPSSIRASIRPGRRSDDGRAKYQISRRQPASAPAGRVEGSVSAGSALRVPGFDDGMARTVPSAPDRGNRAYPAPIRRGRPARRPRPYSRRRPRDAMAADRRASVHQLVVAAGAADDDLPAVGEVLGRLHHRLLGFLDILQADRAERLHVLAHQLAGTLRHRSEEHTSELQSLMRISYAVFCLKKKILNDYQFILL